MSHVDDFERFRPFLFSIAYRMLGNVTEAEDVVQDVWLRYSNAHVLAQDAGFWGDGGGRVPATKHPIFGRDNVVELLLGFRRTAPAAGIPLEKISVEIVEINFDPAMVVRVDGRMVPFSSFRLPANASLAFELFARTSSATSPASSMIELVTAGFRDCVNQAKKRGCH